MNCALEKQNVRNLRFKANVTVLVASMGSLNPWFFMFNYRKSKCIMSTFEFGAK